jgi:chloramphenicol 3-O-phosphotransferase
VTADVIMLTGPSGVGKSTVALSLQQVLAAPWVFFEYDRCSPRLPMGNPAMTSVSESQILRANLAAARAYVDSGFHMIVEITLIDDDLDVVRETLAGLEVFTVVLDCSRAELAAHLTERQSRVPVDQALDFYEKFADRWPTYADLRLTVDGLRPEQAAVKIAESVGADYRGDLT